MPTNTPRTERELDDYLAKKHAALPKRRRLHERALQEGEQAYRDYLNRHKPVDADTQKDRAATEKVLRSEKLSDERLKNINDQSYRLKQHDYKKAHRFIAEHPFLNRDEKVQMVTLAHRCATYTNHNPYTFITKVIDRLIDRKTNTRSQSSLAALQQPAQETKHQNETPPKPRAQSEPQPRTVSAPTTTNPASKEICDQRKREVEAVAVFRERMIKQTYNGGRRYHRDRKSPLALLAESGAKDFDLDKLKQLSESQFAPIKPN